MMGIGGRRSPRWWSSATFTLFEATWRKKTTLGYQIVKSVKEEVDLLFPSFTLGALTLTRKQEENYLYLK